MAEQSTRVELQNELEAALKATRAELAEKFVAAEKAAAVRDEAVQGRLSRQQADDRSAIAKIIVWAFVVLMAWTVVAVTLGMIFFEWDALSEPAKFLMTILSSVMLPVVTLVIGYYFGAEKN